MYKKTITSDDLHEQSFIALVKSNIGRTVIDRVLHKSKSRPNIIAEVSDQETAMTFVKNGLGISLINSFPIIETEGVIYREFTPTIMSNICFFTSKKLSMKLNSILSSSKSINQKPRYFQLPLNSE